jgi:hypothetical protein
VSGKVSVPSTPVEPLLKGCAAAVEVVSIVASNANPKVRHHTLVIGLRDSCRQLAAVILFSSLFS